MPVDAAEFAVLGEVRGRVSPLHLPAPRAGPGTRLEEGVTAAQLRAAADGHVMAHGTLVGVAAR